MAEISDKHCRALDIDRSDLPKKPWSTLLTEEQREAYRDIHRTLAKIADSVSAAFPGELRVITTAGFSEKSGIRNAVPKDMWCALANPGSDAFINMPQLYMIVSEAGVEMGFAAAIHPSDFSDRRVKDRLRASIPSLFALLPDPQAPTVEALQRELERIGGWSFRRKSRLKPGSQEFSGLAELITDLRSRRGMQRGAGAVCRYITPKQLSSPKFNLEKHFREMVTAFMPLMREIRNMYAEATRVAVADEADRLADELSLEQLFERLKGASNERKPSKNHRRKTKGKLQEVARNSVVVAIAKKRAQSTCELPDCPYPVFKNAGGKNYCEVHHIDRLADGGADTPENVVCLCPSHHREAHVGIRRAELKVVMKAIRGSVSANP